jgi:hypothetical protein
MSTLLAVTEITLPVPPPSIIVECLSSPTCTSACFLSHLYGCYSLKVFLHPRAFIVIEIELNLNILCKPQIHSRQVLGATVFLMSLLSCASL